MSDFLHIGLGFGLLFTLITLAFWILVVVFLIYGILAFRKYLQSDG